MGNEVTTVAPPSAEVPMVEGGVVGDARARGARLGSEADRSRAGVARNTVRRYLRGGAAAEVQERPSARCLDGAAWVEALALFEGAAEGNALVVAETACQPEVLGDNSRCLVVGRNREAQTVTFHPDYLAFCPDWDVQPRACQPYRARTKGKTESGVKYVKHNAIAGREFESFAHRRRISPSGSSLPTRASTARHTSSRRGGSSVTSVRPYGRCRRGRSRLMAVVYGGAWPTTRSSTSTRFATAFPPARSRPRRGARHRDVGAGLPGVAKD